MMRISKMYISREAASVYYENGLSWYIVQVYVLVDCMLIYISAEASMDGREFDGDYSKILDLKLQCKLV